MATQTLEATAKQGVTRVPAEQRYQPGVRVTCGDCEREVPIENTYLAGDGKRYCWDTCLAEHLATVD